ncbi:hypothetical protein EYZ11_001347 [Aspergillus tanneri]|uniref:N-acetyltransferase domain-containing protein n=1 Tax=Aspergillus tanneri TaxID=1220188 RepID=A0A4S3JUT8_9EURO|nr:uncharacterized protein ATNIH1004_002970 [Aspergillus tanneri]KAA8650288.1 hypothetical protein ATNIH1004_002970 [Aspergillus tanneri]THC99172.1 hypothetical protein EYZ11_001347 [Aspergillus tanneri]
MQLRPAKLQDLSFIAEVAAQAMLDDELFIFLCPLRKEFYSDYRSGFLRRLRTKLTSPGWVIIVAEDTPTATSGEMSIVGYAAWERIRESGGDPTSPWKESGWWADLQVAFSKLSDNCVAHFYPDRSVDESHLAEYNARIKTECFPFDRFPDIWYLSALAVHPTRQRHGIGQMLVEWGMQQAHKEKVPVGLEASIKGTKLYEKLGFHTVNTLQLVDDIIIRAMLWQPPDGTFIDY